MREVLEYLVNDPINTILSLLLLGLIFLVLKEGWPRLRRFLAHNLGERQLNIVMNLVAQAAQAVEQARKKGELTQLFEALGLDLPVDVSQDEQCRDYVIQYVQRQLDHFPWGHLVNVSMIYTILLSVMRQDGHKGPQTEEDIVVQFRQAPPQVLAQLLHPDQLEMANELQKQMRAAGPVMATSKIIEGGPYNRRNKH